MKKLFIILLGLSISLMAQALTVVSTAGGLSAAITAAGGTLTTVTDLTVTGTIDARDFLTMRDGMTALTTINLSGATIAAYTGTAGTAGTSSSTYPANGVPTSAFSFCSRFTSISMPSSVTSIGGDAFYVCSNLTSMTIPSSVTSIGSYAFGYTGLTSITIPSSVTSILDCTFINCSGITSISISSSVTTIQGGAFLGSGSVTVDAANPNYSSVNGVLFNKDKTILKHCPISMTGSYTIPSSVTTLEDGAFSSCSGLTSVTIPSSVTSIGHVVFGYCSGLTSLNIPSSVTSIGGYAFISCTSLTSLSISSSVTSIGDYAFQGASGLITVDAANQYYSSADGVLFNKTKTILKHCPISKTGSYTIPSSVTSIESAAFYACASLTAVSIPSLVTSIGSMAFRDCSRLTSLTIPSLVTSIGGQAFLGCSSLTNIYAYPTTPVDLSSSSSVFSGVFPSSCILHVPAGSSAAYKAATQWKDFTNIVEGLTAPTVSTKATIGIGTTTATGNGNITALGDVNPTQYGVVWSTATSPTIALSTKTAQGTATAIGSFSSSITGLTSNTRYYLRAYATNGAGTSYGNQISFKTRILVPNISYTGSPKVYSTNTAITAWTPSNSGGTVPNQVAGVVSTFAGSGTASAIDATGTLASFSASTGVAVDTAGNLYVADAGNHKIRKITSAGVVTTIAGNGTAGSANGTGSSATFNTPKDIAVDTAGNMYVADAGNHKIRKITPAGVVTTLAGSGTAGSAEGTGTAATFNGPTGVAVDADGNVYVADAGNNKIRKITPAGVVTTFAGNNVAGAANGLTTAASFTNPTGITIDDWGNLYVADQGNHNIRKITSAGVVTTFAGSGASGSTNGTGTAASFNTPNRLTTDADGNVYVADAGNNNIRKITSAGVVITLAGSGTQGSQDGSSQAATFKVPSGVGADKSGNLYVADAGNNKIRKITQWGYTISPALPAGLTIDGTGTISGTPTANSAATSYTITATNEAGSSSTTVNIQTQTLVPPTITTQAVSNISTTTATGNGTITDFGNPASVTAYGVCYSSTNSTPTTTDNVVNNGAATATGAFTASITGLTPGTTYYVRAYATNSAGTVYGTAVSFTTLKVATVTTQAVSNITTTTATGNVTISDLGVPNPTAYGVCYSSTNTTPTTTDNVVNNGAATATGAFTASITGLTPGTTYYVRAYATNNAGTVYGTAVTFTTFKVATVTTQTVSNITTTTAIGNATISDLGVPNPTAYGVCYSTINNTPTTTDNVVNNGAATATGVFTASMTGLTPGTTYYVRAYATNTVGTTYGSVVTFSTLKMATVTTQSVSGISKTNAIAYGEIIDLGSSTPTAYGVCYSTINSTPTTTDNVVNNGAATATGTFAVSLINLTPGTTYYVRAYATNTGGTTYGTVISFTTLKSASVSTQAVSSITSSTAVANGTITGLGIPSSLTAYGFCYSTTSTTPTTSDNVATKGTTTAASTYTASLTGLTMGTTYYVRAYATNASGTSYGEVVSFTTSAYRALSVKVYLQGLFNGVKMNKCLIEDGATPKFTGTIVDTLSVELHSTSNYNTVIYRAHGLELHQDGTVNTPGLSYIEIPGADNGSYYVTIKTRNHLETTSAQGVSLASSAGATYDFTTSANKAYGSNMGFLESAYVIYAGDIPDSNNQQDGLLDVSDQSAIDNQISQFGTGYLKEDLNGDGLVDLSDNAILEANINNFVSTVLP